MTFFARALLSMATCGALIASAQSVDWIVDAYIGAVGGHQAIGSIHTRKAEAVLGRLEHFNLYWAAPNKVLLTGRNEKQGFDGVLGWEETKKKKVLKLSQVKQDDIETDINPIRFVRLREMYAELNVEKPVTLDGDLMDVISAPNALGATKFYFNHASHLLVRIEDKGVTSAYYTHTLLLEDYKAIDGVQMPTTIVRVSDEPGGREHELKLKHVAQNVTLELTIFSKPDIGPIVAGGKH